MARVAAVEAKAGSMSDAGFLVAVMGLMGHRERDGHSGAWAMAQAGTLLSAWPIWLWDFPDGLRIVAARAPYDGPGRCPGHEGRPRAGRRRARRRRPARAARQRLDAARQPADLPDPPERAGRAGRALRGRPGADPGHAGRHDPRGHARRGPDGDVPRLGLRRLGRPLPREPPARCEGPALPPAPRARVLVGGTGQAGRDVRRLQRGAAPGRRREHALGSRRQAEGDRGSRPRPAAHRRPAQQRRRRQQHVRPAAR